jgi:hypothetical protein
MMKRITEVLIVMALAVCIAGGLSLAAQQQTEFPQATQVAAALQPCSVLQGTHASATTLTISPPAGQFVYVCEIDYQNCEGTAVTAAAPTHITSTGLGAGITPDFLVGSGPATAGTCSQAVNIAYPVGGFKSNTAGANVTFITPTFITNQVVRLNVLYRIGS